MGSYQTRLVTFAHPELFGYAGIFSGFLRAIRGDNNAHLALMADREKFN